ncbi:MAG: hypothetical protein AAFV59_14970 [Pseudomonadota bacterium]
MAEWVAGASAYTESIALLISVTACGLQFAMWHYCMRLLPLYATTSAKAIGVAVMFVLMLGLGLSSTYTSFIGLTQDSARALHLIRESHDYAGFLRAVEARGSGLQDSRDFVAPQAAAACTRYEQEIEHGALTGSSGPGVITNYLLGFCSTKTEMAKALDESLADNAKRQSEITTLVSEMDRLILDKRFSIEEREQMFLVRARKLEEHLRALQASDKTRSVKASYAAMSKSVVGLDGSRSSLAAAQAPIVDAILAEQRSSGEAIQAMIAEIEALPLPTPKRAELVPPQILVWRYWRQHLPQAALALIIDLYAPISTALFWAAALRPARRPRRRK